MRAKVERFADKLEAYLEVLANKIF